MILADLHIHSRYSRATSREGDAPHLEQAARCKGLGLLGTGDFTHPAWRAELHEQLVPAEEGLYRLREEFRLPGTAAGEGEVRFLVSGEISTIYKRGGRTRKVHHVFLLPSLEAADRLAERLEAVGNVRSDGRPILGLDSRDLLALALEAVPDLTYIAAHVWTPHFSLFGAMSGFDTAEECYGDLTPYVRALETGLSSDPPMNRRCAALDRFQLVSSSDAHSPGKLGREATLLDCELSYAQVKRAVETGVGLAGTVEFFPEEGKYHFDGHRACGFSCRPEEAEALQGRCPVCGRKLTMGVAHRVAELADRAEAEAPRAKPYESLLPLEELLADALGAAPSSKRVQAAYHALLKDLGPEMRILREVSIEEMERTAGPVCAEALRRLRAGEVLREAGFDGQYGRIALLRPGERERLAGQTALLPVFAPLPPKKTRAQAAQAQEADKARVEAAKEALNPGQRAAVEARDAALAVIAGPGTGKTRTLVARAAALLRAGVPGREMTVVTFTRRAAQELRERLAAEVGAAALREVTIGTFHAVCQARLPKKPLLTREEGLRLMTELLRARGEEMPASEALRRLSAAKNGGDVELPEGLVEAYQAALVEKGARDLDDLLLEGREIRDAAFTHLLVDEYQDVCPVQRELIERWSAGGRTLFVIGDPDQSIYGFRGASAESFQALQAARPELRVLRLADNYRSSPAILRAAQAVIAANGGGERALVPHSAEGAPVRLVCAPDEESEAAFLAAEIGRQVGGLGMLEAEAREKVRAFSDIAVLCRTHRGLERVEAALRRASIPCEVSGRGGLLQEERVRGAAALYRGLCRPWERESLREGALALFSLREGEALAAAQAVAAGGELETLARELPALQPLAQLEKRLRPLLHGRPRRALEALGEGLGWKAEGDFRRLLQAAALFDRAEAFLDALTLGEEADIRRLSGAKAASGAVRLMTLHAAKGLEFPLVLLAGCASGELPLDAPGRHADVREERRLLFVGITRAREELILTCGGEPSPFLRDLPAEVRRETAPALRREAPARQISFFDP